MAKENNRKFLYAACATILLILTASSGVYNSYSAFATSSSPAGIMVPLYTYPGSTWDSTVNAKEAYPSVPIAAIVNPSNGPGYSKDSNYEAGIQKLNDAGVIVLGYVSTAYTGRDINAVKSDIDSWKSWYPNVGGIFFDEQTNWSGGEWYYSQVNEYAKAQGFTMTVGNPGANSIPSYLDTVDVVLIYESPGLPNLDNYQEWSSYANGKLGMIPFGVGSMPTQWVEDATELVGWIYVTDDNLSNPWDSLPSYFDELVSAVGNGSTSPTAPVPVPTVPSVPTYSLTVKSVDQNGDAINGMWVEVNKDGQTVKTGFTPHTIALESSSTYTVSTSDYQQIIFDHWSDGTKSNNIPITMTSNDKVLTAHYQSGAAASSTTEPTLTIKSVDQNGNEIDGLWTEIKSEGITIETGFTPLVYTTQPNLTYEVAVGDYQNYLFDDWQDTNSSVRERSVNMQQSDVELVAVYQDTTLPFTDTPEPESLDNNPSAPENTFTITGEGNAKLRKAVGDLSKGMHTVMVKITGEYNFDEDGKLTISKDSLAGTFTIDGETDDEIIVDLDINTFKVTDKDRKIRYSATIDDGDISGKVSGILKFRSSIDFADAEDADDVVKTKSKLTVKIEKTSLPVKRIAAGEINFS